MVRRAGRGGLGITVDEAFISLGENLPFKTSHLSDSRELFEKKQKVENKARKSLILNLILKFISV